MEDLSQQLTASLRFEKGLVPSASLRRYNTCSCHLHMQKLIIMILCIQLWFYANIRTNNTFYFYYIILWLHDSAPLGHLQAIQVPFLKQNQI